MFPAFAAHDCSHAQLSGACVMLQASEVASVVNVIFSGCTRVVGSVSSTIGISTLVHAAEELVGLQANEARFVLDGRRAAPFPLALHFSFCACGLHLLCMWYARFCPTVLRFSQGFREQGCVPPAVRRSEWQRSPRHAESFRRWPTGVCFPRVRLVCLC